MPLTLHDITCDDAYRGVLSALLRDRSQPNSTGSIIWATGAYANHGVGYAGSDMMTVETVRHLVSIGELVPRCEKDAATQQRRTADKAEVFTPSWLCNDMINGIEECEFGAGARPFNDESDGPRGWKATVGEISFPEGVAESGAGSGKRLVPAKPRWYRYIGFRCLEITCGEAPYLTSRYDAVTNEPIPQAERIGFLDRKIRIAVENTPAGSSERKKASQLHKRVRAGGRQDGRDDDARRRAGSHPPDGVLQHACCAEGGSATTLSSSGSVTCSVTARAIARRCPISS